MSVLTVENVTCSFGDKVVLEDVSFMLLAGEHVGLIGRNGAGKTTLMNVLTGHQLPDTGTVQWSAAAKPGYLTQHFDVDPGATVRDVLREAFAPLFAAEREMAAVTERMGTASGEELESLLARFARLQTELEEGDFYAVDAEIEKVAAGLGLVALGLETEISHLSGGQRTKVLLAKLLIEKPKVLLLDEPTNYLDAEHVAWLSEYLKTYPHAFILVTHDTDVIRDLATIIYHVENHVLTRYPFGYARFLEAYELRRNQATEAYDRQQREIARLETYIQKNKVRASTARQAKSREKRLAKMERLEKPRPAPPVHVRFRVAREPVSVVFETNDLAVGYERQLLPPLTLRLDRGQKVALTGANGIGKSTLLRTLLGYVPRLGGSVELGDRVQPAYFEQELEGLDGRTALEEITQHFPKLTQKEARGALAQCGLRAEHIFEPLRALSGGEQAKVRLCRLMLESSNWLVLDEPTNHLDEAAKKALQGALTAYKGTVLLVSHEPDFYAPFASDVWNVDAWKARASVHVRQAAGQRSANVKGKRG